MNRAVIGLLVIFPAGFLWGCGGSVSQSGVLSAQHGGSIIGLPDSLGSVELKIDHGAPTPKGSRKEQRKSRILAYFYGPTSAALSPAPADVKVSLGGSATATVIDLVPQSKEPGEFASEPGEYPDELRGQIAFQLDGKPVQATFSFR